MSLEQRFIAQATLTGFDVIDVETGHSMGFESDDRRSCNGIAQSLNQAAKLGPQVLAFALRAN